MRVISKVMTWAIMSLCVISSSIAQANDDVTVDRQVMCLAQNIYYEAGLEPFRGKVAVAQVTVNRTESGNFPSTICGVVHQKTQVAGKMICQFSWSCNPVNKVKYLSNAWQDSLLVAEQVLRSNLRMEKLNGPCIFMPHMLIHIGV
jgi:spore germination cell wall hydrolase CwlJ-like protein